MRGTSETSLLHTKSVVAASQPYITQPPAREGGQGATVSVSDRVPVFRYECGWAPGRPGHLAVWGPENAIRRLRRSGRRRGVRDSRRVVLLWPSKRVSPEGSA